MNEWVEKSLRVAESQNYLDRLSEIYPAKPLPRRPLEDDVKNRIRELHGRGDWKELLKIILKQSKRGHPFPVEHPYASILRQKPKLMENNPKVTQTLGSMLLKMSIDEIFRGIERSIDINRVMGPAFHNWLRRYFPSQGIPVLPQHRFESYKDKAFLDARNASILKYLNEKFGYVLDRGRDFLFRTADKLVVGEARFLSTSGGSQTRDLKEVIEFVRKMKEKIVAVGVVDGIVWFNRSYIKLLSGLADDEPVLSALLLKDFLGSLG
ncbi:MAG: hypothetical protein QW569_06315 [Candidatus Bathyarchaeia archaeon]|nr:hypothetical protein [Candidatus Bathyarchaeota archaeon]